MNPKRGFWILGLLGALALAGGCDKGTSTPQNPPANPAPPSPTPQPKVATVVPVADNSGAGKTVTPGPGVASTAPAEPGPPFDPKKSPQTARLPGWYQWRGPEQNGVSREKALPESWDPNTGENVIWAADVGGMSSPVIWNGKLYTFTRAGEEQANGNLVPGHKTREALTCVDINTGKVLWQNLENMTQTEVPFHRLGWSSPCVDPSTGRVYALGSQCWLLCLDGETGKTIWERQMTEEFGMISTFGGRTQSPMVDEDQVFITGVSFGWGDQARGNHRIYALNKNTGELNWVTGTGGIPVDAPQNTPVIAVVNGQRLVIFAAGDGGIHAFQSRTGKKVWTFKASKRGINTSVVVDGDRLYCSHGLDNFDESELGRVFCLDIAHLDEKGSPKELWKKTGVEAAFPTSCVTDKYMYLVDDRAKLYQFDKMTGKLMWKKGFGTVGKPSPVFGDGKLYVADGNGKFSIVKPADKLNDVKVLNQQDLPDKLGREYSIYGSPALCDGRLYLQTATKLYCIGKTAAAGNPPGKDAAAALLRGGDRSAAPATAPAADAGAVVAAKGEYGDIPPLAEEKPAENKAALVQIVPADAALHAGQSVKFGVRTFDANGRLVASLSGDKAQWAIGQLTIPPPPPRPAMPKPENAPAAAPAPPAAPATAPAAAGGPVDPAKLDPELAKLWREKYEPRIIHVAQPGKPDQELNRRNVEEVFYKDVAELQAKAAGAAAPADGASGTAVKSETPDAARAQLAAAAQPAAPAAAQPAAPAAAPPATGPTKAGNLLGDVAADGTFHSKPGPHQAGTVQATVDGVTGEARVRVFPPLPWKIDFEPNPVGKPPLTWLGAGGKYAVVDDPDKAGGNKVLQKLMDVDLYYRARTNFGMVDMTDYTVQADAMLNQQMVGGRRAMPTAAVMNSRYVLALDGMGQFLQIHVWPSALPDDNNPHGSQQKTMPFEVGAKKWYRLKLQVTQEGDNAVARGKAWPADGQEPADWMLTLTDPIPNRMGNPGLFSVSLVGQLKSEVWYDNVLVTPNHPPAAGAGGAHAVGGTGGGDLNK